MELLESQFHNFYGTDQSEIRHDQFSTPTFAQSGTDLVDAIEMLRKLPKTEAQKSRLQALMARLTSDPIWQKYQVGIRRFQQQMEWKKPPPSADEIQNFLNASLESSSSVSSKADYQSTTAKGN